MGMALTPLSGKTSISIFDPCSLDPLPSWFLLNSDLARPSCLPHRHHSAVDWKETPKAHTFRVDLPGLKKEEIKVELQDGRILSISGERSKEETQETGRWHRVERSHGSFFRRFRLPDNARPDDVNAQMENGVLTINIPKLQKPTPDVRSITISG